MGIQKTCYSCGVSIGPFRVMGEVTVCADAGTCNVRVGWTSYQAYKQRK